MKRERRLALVAMVAMVSSAGAALPWRVKARTAEFGPAVSLKAMFPAAFGRWRIDEGFVPLLPSPEVQRVIDETYDQVLARTYIDEDGYGVMLSVAYGGRQTEAMNTHRPEVCYPAQGLSVRRETWHETLDVAGRPLPLRRLVAGKGRRNEPISYWLVVGRNVTEFGWQHKLATVKYGLTGRIPDGMLVRVSSIDDNDARAFAMQDRFLRDLLAAMHDDDRRRVLGALDA